MGREEHNGGSRLRGIDGEFLEGNNALNMSNDELDAADKPSKDDLLDLIKGENGRD